MGAALAYERPVLRMSEGVAEGVFAASGASAYNNCWTVNIKTAQDYNGSARVYEVSLVHTNMVSHASNACTVQYVFSSDLSGADVWAEGDGHYEVSISGNTVRVTRKHHANGDYSGDNVTYKLFVNTGDEATTKALGDPTCTVVDCDKTGTPNHSDID